MRSAGVVRWPQSLGVDIRIIQTAAYKDYKKESAIDGLLFGERMLCFGEEHCYLPDSLRSNFVIKTCFTHFFQQVDRLFHGVGGGNFFLENLGCFFQSFSLNIAAARGFSEYSNCLLHGVGGVQRLLDELY